MPSTLRDICFDCADAGVAARFWSEVLGHPMSEGSDGAIALIPKSGGLRYWFVPVPEAKVAKNRVHIDINMPDDAEMQRLIDLGARPLGEIRGDDGTLWWTVMADPEGNEFCAFPPKQT